MLAMKRAKKIAALAFASSIPAILAASAAIYALIQNNNQGEAFDTITGAYRYCYLLNNFAIIFGIVFFAVAFEITWYNTV